MSGEVAVTRHGHQTAIESPELDGRIDVDLEGDRPPQVAVPAGTHVRYRDPEDDESDDEPELATDGGVYATHVATRGVGLPEPWDFFTGVGGFFAALAGGYMWSTDYTAAALVIFVASAMLVYFSARAYGARVARGGGA